MGVPTTYLVLSVCKLILYCPDAGRMKVGMRTRKAKEANSTIKGKADFKILHCY